MLGCTARSNGMDAHALLPFSAKFLVLAHTVGAVVFGQFWRGWAGLGRLRWPLLSPLVAALVDLVVDTELHEKIFGLQTREEGPRGFRTAAGPQCLLEGW